MTESKKPRIIVTVLVFLVAIVVWNYVLVGRNNKGSSESGQATLPLLSVEMGKSSINQLHGYVGNVDKALLRDSITPLEGDSLTVSMKYGSKSIEAMNYKLYMEDNQKVLEKGVVAIQNKKANIRISKRLETGKTYLLALQIKKDKQKITYYTRVIYGTKFHLKECLAFANKFHKATLSGSDSDFIKRYIESKEGETANDLSTIDINSDQEAVQYAGLNPEVEETYTPTIKELSPGIASIEMKTMLSAENSKGIKQYYMVTEYYRVRYSGGKNYLLNYERNQESYVRYDTINASANQFVIGIASNNLDELKSVDGGKKVAFVQQNELWEYDYDEVSMTRVFSFVGEDYREERRNYDHHGIHIVDTKSNGDVTFVVYGYMNGGKHEGENGISVYQYNAKKKEVEERIFIPTKLQYDNLETEMKKGLYLSQDDKLYFTLDAALYEVDVDGKDTKVLAKNIENGFVVVSNNGMLAMGNSKHTVTVMNLENDTSYSIKCKAGEVIKPIGFVKKDFVYGVAYEDDISTDSDGTMNIPMKFVYIINQKKETLKTYGNDGTYIVDASVDGTVVTVTPATRVGDGFKKKKTEYIRYRESTKDKAVLEYKYSQDRLNLLSITFPDKLYVQSEPKYESATIDETNSNYNIDFEKNRKRGQEAYVYAGGSLLGTYESVNQAISKAEKSAGVVVNSDQYYLWEKGVAKTYGKAPNVVILKAKQKDESAITCIQMMARAASKSCSYEKLAASKLSTFDLLNQVFDNLAYNYSGTSLDDVLYCVYKGRPIMTKMSNNHYVLIMSYNSTKIRYIDPISGKSVQTGRTNFEKDIKKAGNIFYSYTD